MLESALFSIKEIKLFSLPISVEDALDFTLEFFKAGLIPSFSPELKQLTLERRVEVLIETVKQTKEKMVRKIYPNPVIIDIIAEK
jgi:hypothetical protein